MKQWLKKTIGTLLSDTRQAIIGIIVAAVVVSIGSIYLFAKQIWFLLISTMQIPTPLWTTIGLILSCCLFTYLKLQQHQKLDNPPTTQEELREEFGVYWNNQYKLRCLKCKWPLKHSSKVHDSSTFFCSNCNTKFILRDPEGLFLTEAQAIEQLKNLLTGGSTGGSS
jgi:hypothetical protein